MKNPRKLLEIAASMTRMKEDKRTFFLAAIAIRNDGAIVSSVNGSSTKPEPLHHAETRLIRKLDQGATIYLARTLTDGSWGNSFPCGGCRRALKRAKVKKLFYTIGPNNWGVLYF